MRRYSLTARRCAEALRSRAASRRGALRATRARWTAFAVTSTFLASMTVATSGAQAVVVNDGGTQAGVALVPFTSLPGGVTAVNSAGPCTDPALTSDLILTNSGLCFHGGAVMHSNETFALTWDPARRYWATTRNYVEQFLSDVASGSGTFGSPYAVTSQYTDGSGRAQNASLFGGGCVDYGNPGGYTCQFGNTTGSGTGNNYPVNGCPVSGLNRWYGNPNGPISTGPNDICLTDAQIQGEVATMTAQSGLLGRTKPGYTPLVVLLTPPGVETCLDAGGTLCSANSAATGRFCSYHSQVNVNGTNVAYVVQPWTASWDDDAVGCDDPAVTQIGNNPSVQQLALDVGNRLVSPLSQAHLGAIINPNLNGWFALNGSEVMDNGCTPLAKPLDIVSVGGNAYPLQREFNNAGAIETDPNALPCTPNVLFTPAFVVPSAVNQGDEIQFDGSTTVSSLIVPKGSYAWDFGDGATAVGPSVVHSYAAGGTYTVKLTVTDRGGNVATLTQPIQVMGANGQPVPPSSPPPPTSNPGSPSQPGLNLSMMLVINNLKKVLSSGVGIRVSSNERADGMVWVTISAADAKRAHLGNGHTAVMIGRGTVSRRITNGTVALHLRLSRVVSRKLARLHNVVLTVHLSVVAADGQRVTRVAQMQYRA
jgi:PKD domain